MGQPVVFTVEKPSGPRNRLTALARPILVIPHALLVGGPVLGIGGGGYRSGALGLLAATIALFDWVAILFTGRPLAGLQGLKRLYLGWRARVLAYASFLRDEYPPFGEGEYPAVLQLPPEPSERDRLTVALRPLLLIPHLFVLLALLIAEVIVCLVSWLSIVFTGKLGDGLWRFSRDVMAYTLRIETYALLVHDQYPPFVFGEERQTSTAEAQ